MGAPLIDGVGADIEGAVVVAASGTCAESELDVSAEAGRGGGEARRAAGAGSPAIRETPF